MSLGVESSSVSDDTHEQHGPVQIDLLARWFCAAGSRTPDVFFLRANVSVALNVPNLLFVGRDHNSFLFV